MADGIFLNTEEIQNEVAEYFSKEAQKNLKESMKNFYTKITRILNAVASDEAITNEDTMRLLGEAYVLIMEFRKFITNEKIQYRYYCNIDGKTAVSTFTEDQILKYFKLENGQISIAANEIKELMKENKSLTKQNKFQLALRKHEKKILNSIISTSGKDYVAPGMFLVKSSVIEFYGKKDGEGRLLYDSLPNLIFLDQSKWKYGKNSAKNINNAQNSNSKVSRSWVWGRKQFNMGHFYEAFDRAIAEGEAKTDVELLELIVTEYLAHDSQSAFRGGDTKDSSRISTQIKSNQARVQKYSSIVIALKKLQKFFQKATQGEEQKEIIEDLFLSNDKIKSSTEQALNEAAERKIKNIIKALSL